MFPPRLKQILALAKKTGESVIIYDASEENEAYVLSPLDDYLANNKLEPQKKEAQLANLESQIEAGGQESEERLTGLDLTDKINQEISMLNQQSDSAVLAEEDKIKKNWQIPPAVKNKALDIE